MKIAFSGPDWCVHAQAIFRADQIPAGKTAGNGVISMSGVRIN
jgi:hypothetical protein